MAFKRMSKNLIQKQKILGKHNSPFWYYITKIKSLGNDGNGCAKKRRGEPTCSPLCKVGRLVRCAKIPHIF